MIKDIVNKMLICFFTTVLAFYTITTFFHKKYYNSYKRIINHKDKKEIVDKDYTRTRYNRKRIPTKIDTIVIGSGIGGLTSAALLSKFGKRVLVLEQHYIAGGTMHSFVDKGVEHETGLHYIGNIEKRKKILDLICYKPIEWCKLGWEREDKRFVYDELFIEDDHYELEAGEKNIVNYLTRKFPHINKHLFVTYFKHIKYAASKDTYFISKIIPYHFLIYIISLWDKDYYYYCNTKAIDLINQIFNFPDENLISVLFGQFGDYGVMPNEVSFFVHANIVNHYLDGGWFPKGGTGVIANEICKTIEHNNGAVLVGKKVDEILIHKNNAYGVRMETGDIIYCNEVISAAGLRNTFDKLVKKDIKLYKDMLENMGPSVQHMYCFVKLDGNPKDLKLRSSNFWIYPDKNYDRLFKNFLENPLEEKMPLFMGFSSMKDENWSKNYPGVSNAIILTVAKKEWFNEWEHEKCTKRSDDYVDFKNRIGERMLEEGLFRFYPDLRDKVLETNIGTPLSTQFYLNAVDGESYGLDMNNYRLTKTDALRPKTTVNNLYITGQDICTLGITGAMMGGVLTASSVAKYDNIMDIILGNNIVKDLYML